MMFSNSLRLAQAPGRAHADLIRLALPRRRIADAAGGDVHVLLAQRVHDIARRELPRGQPHRIQPDAHRELALAEDDDVGDARAPASARP